MIEGWGAEVEGAEIKKKTRNRNKRREFNVIIL